MQSFESPQVKVGIFIFVGVLLAMVVIFFLGGEKQLFTRHYTLQTSFRDISGLRVGAPVLLAGVRVGMVERIEFSSDLNEIKVFVWLSVNRGFQERIRRDSTATINTQGLLGDKLITIGLGSETAEILKDGDSLNSEEKPSLFSFTEKGGEILENVNKAAEAIGKLLAEMEQGQVAGNISETAKELKIASTEVREVMQKINKGEGTVGALLEDPGVYNDIRSLFGKLERNKLLRAIIRSRIQDLESERIQPRHFPARPRQNP